MTARVVQEVLDNGPVLQLAKLAQIPRCHASLWHMVPCDFGGSFRLGTMIPIRCIHQLLSLSVLLSLSIYIYIYDSAEKSFLIVAG